MNRVIAGKFSSRVEADLAAEFLAEQDIDATVTADDAGGALPSLQAVAGATVQVAAVDLERATELLRDYTPPQKAAQTELPRARRAQRILVLVLFGASLFFLVAYAAIRMQPSQ